MAKTVLTADPVWRAMSDIRSGKLRPHLPPNEPVKRERKPRPRRYASPNGAAIPANIAENPIARQILTGKSEQAFVDPEVMDEWTRTIEDRQAKIHALDCYPGGIFPWTSDFLADEHRRKTWARGALLAGEDALLVAIHAGLSEEEIETIREKLQ